MAVDRRVLPALEVGCKVNAINAAPANRKPRAVAGAILA
jgi:hypothetical protein